MPAALLVATSFVFAGCSDRETAELVRVETEKAAIEILVELESAGLPATKSAVSENRKTVWSIGVDPGRLAAAQRVLVHRGLPRSSYGGYEAMLGSSGMFPNKTDERTRLMRAQAEELAATLEACDGVVEARVHINIPEKARSRTAVDELPTASVLIRYTPRAMNGRDGQRMDPIATAAGTDSLPYSVPVPREILAAHRETIRPEASASDAKTTPPATVSAPSPESNATTSRNATTSQNAPPRYPLGEGVARDATTTWNPMWPLTPSAVCWQVAGGVEGLEPWAVTVLYSMSPPLEPRDLASTSTSETAVTPRAQVTLYKLAAAVFGVTTVLLAFLLIRLRRRAG